MFTSNTSLFVAALARSKSTPGLVESSGKVSLQAMPLPQGFALALQSRAQRGSPCSSRASDDSDDPSHSNSDNNAQSGSHSRSHSSHQSDDANGFAHSQVAAPTLTEPDITNSMTVSSITSYITDSSVQKSPLGTEAPRSVSSSPRHLTKAIASIVPACTYTTASYNAPVSALDSLSSSRQQSPFTVVPETLQEQSIPLVAPYPVAATPAALQQQQQHISPVRRPGSDPLTPFQSIYPGHAHTFPPSSDSTSTSHIPRAVLSGPPFRASSGNLGASLLGTGSTGSLQRDPNNEILLAEISRLRERLQTLETENTAMSLKLNQQQHDVEHRLAEIEMHFCGSDSVASGSDDHPTEGNKESVI